MGGELLGAVGYYQQQVSSGSGPGTTSARDRVAAVGPEISAEDRQQGHHVALTLTERF